MAKNSVNPSFVPSLLGGVCLSDILPDLPLPSHLPTSLESSILYPSPLRDDTKKILNTASTPVSQRIAAALSKVNLDFLKLNESSEKLMPLEANDSLPPLVNAVLLCKAAQPVVVLNRMEVTEDQRHTLVKTTAMATPHQDPDDSFRTPQGFAKQRTVRAVPPSDTIGSSTSACLLASGTHVTPQGATKKQKRRQRLSSESSDGVPTVPRMPSLDQPVETTTLPVSINLGKLKQAPESEKNKIQRKRSKSSSENNSLIVSIPRKYLKSLQAVPTLELELEPLSTAAVVAVPAGYSTEDTQPAKKKKKKKAFVEDVDPMQSEVYNRYLSLMEHVQQLAELGLPHALATVEERGVPHEFALPYNFVYQLLIDTVGLKNQRLLHLVPKESLLHVVSLMQLQILDSQGLNLRTVPEGLSNEDVSVWRQVTISRILRGLDAALVILHIGTAPRVSQQVHQDEAYERVVTLSRFHLETNIYPEFDPIYKAGVDSTVGIKSKRRYAGGPGKHVYPLYQKLTEVVDVLAQLLHSQPQPDTFVLQVSGMGMMPFFVENVSVLQLSAMKLVRTIFSKYEKHRDLILEDIFASLARLPTSKKNVRAYKLAGGQTIQMVTALILQMAQCIVVNPASEDPLQKVVAENEKEMSAGAKQEQMDKELLMSFNTASTFAKTFLSTFMKKCCSGSKDEEDFRPLFDNFVQDLLVTLHLPEWPAAELLLMLMGGLLTQTFMNKSNDSHLRLLALEHIGSIAGRLRRDAMVTTDEDNEVIIDVISQVLQCKVDSKSPSPTGIGKLDAFSENTQHLQRALIAYLNRRTQLDPACSYAVDFSVGQWVSDLYSELERSGRARQGDEDRPAANAAQLQEDAQQKKEFLRTLLYKSSKSRRLEDVLDDEKAVIVTRFLSSFRSLSKSFDYLLRQLLMVLKDSSVHVRTKAMKSLSAVVAIDPSILSRSEVCHSIQYHIADGSALVREAAVELLGKFVLTKPDLVTQYYDMLIVRMLDTSVSVRKRVIKIFRDICLQLENFPKRSDVYGKILRRISDEEAVQNLVTSVFQSLWFTLPQVSGLDLEKELQKRVLDIMDVISVDDVVHEFFEQLLHQLVTSDKGMQPRVLLDVWQQMVDTIVRMLLTLDEKDGAQPDSNGVGGSLLASVTTLYLFCKVHPALLVRHTTTLQPYLSIKCTGENDVAVIVYVTRILEKVIPLVAHPDTSFLSSVEEEMVKLILKQGPNVLQACVGCMDAVANKVTHNYKLVADCFQKFYVFLERVRLLHSRDQQSPQLASQRSLLLRSLFVVSLMCRHFDFDQVSTEEPLPDLMLPVKEKVLAQLTYFTEYCDEEVRLKAVSGLGFFCIRYPDCMLEKRTHSVYLAWLGNKASVKQKMQLLRNLLYHFSEDEVRWKEKHRHRKASAADASDSDSETLADMGDQLSLVNSRIAQAYASEVFACYFHHKAEVRSAVMQVVSMVLKLGLVPPAQCAPWLMAMTTDCEPSISAKACQWVSDLDSRYGGFTQNQLLAGLKYSYDFQCLLSPGIVRGCSEDMSDPESMFAHVYTLLRSSRQKRRPFLRTIINQFTDRRNSVHYLLYLADILAYFPYNTLEEPLFVIHETDMAMAVHGAAVYQGFREALQLGSEEDEDSEKFEALCQRPCDMEKLRQCCSDSQSCFLLLTLSLHLKLGYNLNDSKCSKYNPNESTKQFDKSVVRKQAVLFSPTTVLEHLRGERATTGRAAGKTKEDLLQLYMQFKKLMNSMDPFEDILSPEPVDTATTLRSSSPPAEEITRPQTSDAAVGVGQPAVDPPAEGVVAEPVLKGGTRPRLSSVGSNESNGSRRSSRSRKSSSDSGSVRSGSNLVRKRKKPTRLGSDSDPDGMEDDPDYK